MQIEIQKLPRVVERCGLSMSVVWAKTREEEFPPPVKLGVRAVGWLSNEIDAWIAAKAAGKSNNEIRELVKKLVAGRTAEQKGDGHE